MGVVYRPSPVVAGAALLALALSAACRREPAPPEMPEFQVWLLTSGPITGRWEGDAERGLGRVAAELGAWVARVRAASERERRDTLVSAGRAGIDLVFCVGTGFEGALYTEAVAFPDTRFVLLPGSAGDGNVAGIEFLPVGAGYVAGVVAAHIAPEAPVGVIRGAGGAWLEELEEGFVAGVRASSKGADVPVVTTPEGPRELAREGVRVALYATDVIEARVLAQCGEVGLRLVASDVVLLERDPEVTVAAVQVDVPEAMVRVATEVRDGTFRGGSYLFDLGSGVLDVVLGPSLTDDERRLVDDAMGVARSEVTAGIVELEQLGM